MEPAEIEVSEIYIDPRKAAYIERHGVTEHDVIQVHLNAPKYFLFDAVRNGFDMIGPNRHGRFLVVG
ncbi:MAG: hypothetical protein AB7T32_07125 [Dehalococcoidia bacterium]